MPKPLTENEWKSVLGEGIHTAFRKGSDHPRSSEYWNLINSMPNELWNDVLGYVVWGLESMDLIETKDE